MKKEKRNFHVEAFTDLMTSYIDIPWIFNGSIVAAAKNYHKIFEENCIYSPEKKASIFYLLLEQEWLSTVMAKNRETLTFFTMYAPLQFWEDLSQGH